jgi:5-methylcytosine-specific restriction endonuclease McrA
MSKMYELSKYPFILELWDETETCSENCGYESNHKDHRLCAICRKIIFFGDYKAKQPDNKFAWNIDHIIPKSRWEEYWNWKGYYPNYSVDDIENCQIVHVKCNEWKADHILINGEYI